MLQLPRHWQLHPRDQLSVRACSAGTAAAATATESAATSSIFECSGCSCFGFGFGRPHCSCSSVPLVFFCDRRIGRSCPGSSFGCDCGCSSSCGSCFGLGFGCDEQAGMERGKVEWSSQLQGSSGSIEWVECNHCSFSDCRCSIQTEFAQEGQRSSNCSCTRFAQLHCSSTCTGTRERRVAQAWT